MFKNSSVKNFIRTQEEILSPLLQVPLVMGCDCFVITLQDIRKLQNVRTVCFNKLLPNGYMQPLDPDSMDCLKRSLQACNIKETNPLLKELSEILEANHINIINSELSEAPKVVPHSDCMNTNYTSPMECMTTQPNPPQREPPVQQPSSPPRSTHYAPLASQPCSAAFIQASIEQQIEWNKCKSSKFFPFTYSKQTSTTDICSSVCPPTSTCNCPNKSFSAPCPFNLQNRNVTFKKSSTFDAACQTLSDSQVSTMGAREQLKQRKMLRSALFSGL